MNNLARLSQIPDLWYSSIIWSVESGLIAFVDSWIRSSCNLCIGFSTSVNKNFRACYSNDYISSIMVSIISVSSELSIPGMSFNLYKRLLKSVIFALSLNIIAYSFFLKATKASDCLLWFKSLINLRVESGSFPAESQPF